MIRTRKIVGIVRCLVKRGWGLGLSLAKRIIKDYHKGKIRVMESKKDQGTTFEITLNKA